MQYLIAVYGFYFSGYCDTLLSVYHLTTITVLGGFLISMPSMTGTVRRLLKEENEVIWVLFVKKKKKNPWKPTQ